VSENWTLCDLLREVEQGTHAVTEVAPVVKMHVPTGHAVQEAIDVPPVLAR
jgi:hypothetical protein